MRILIIILFLLLLASSCSTKKKTIVTPIKIPYGDLSPHTSIPEEQ